MTTEACAISKLRCQQGNILMATMVAMLIIGLALLTYLQLAKNQNQLVFRSQVWNACLPVVEVGALDATTLIYANGDGIHRSKDVGVTWTKASSVNPQTRTPVLFHGTHYLGSTNGLLVITDLGASWRAQGAAVNIWQGPFFGRDETELLVIGKIGVFMTRNAGESWKQVASFKPKEGGFVFTPNWFGCYAWDPMNNILYASSMANPVYKMEL